MRIFSSLISGLITSSALLYSSLLTAATFPTQGSAGSTSNDMMGETVGKIHTVLQIVIFFVALIVTAFVAYQLINAFIKWNDERIDTGKFTGVIGSGGAVLAIVYYILYYAYTNFLPGIAV